MDRLLRATVDGQSPSSLLTVEPTLHRGTGSMHGQWSYKDMMPVLRFSNARPAGFDTDSDTLTQTVTHWHRQWHIDTDSDTLVQTVMHWHRQWHVDTYINTDALYPTLLNTLLNKHYPTPFPYTVNYRWVHRMSRIFINITKVGLL